MCYPYFPPVIHRFIHIMIYKELLILSKILLMDQVRIYPLSMANSYSKKGTFFFLNQLVNIIRTRLAPLFLPYFCILTLMLSFEIFTPIQAQTPFRIIQDTTVIILDKQLFIMEEPEGGIDMSNPIQPESFHPFDNTYKLTSGKTYWGYIYLNQQLDFMVQWIFTPNWPMDATPHDEVAVYFRYADSILHRKSGISLPTSARDIADGPGNPVHFYLFPGQGVEIFFRIENKDGKRPAFSPALVDYQFWRTYYREVPPNWLGIILGVLIPFIIGLGGWFIFQKKRKT